MGIERTRPSNLQKMLTDLMLNDYFRGTRLQTLGYPKLVEN
jgi:hypothetical protein